MSSTKEFRDYILDQLSDLPAISCRPMMGEYLLYSDGVLFGGIYDDRLLIKRTKANESYHLPEAIPYPGGKPMYFVEDVDDKEKLAEIVNTTVKGLTSK